MGMEFETTGSIEFEPGPYEGHLIKMEKRSKIFITKNEDNTEEKEDRSFLIWYWAIDEEGYEDVTLTSISSTSWGPKSKARRWAGIILRRKIEDGEKVREDDLKGKPVMLNIENEETEKGTFARIADLAQVRTKKAKSSSPSSKPAELSEKDIQKMNDALGEAS